MIFARRAILRLTFGAPIVASIAASDRGASRAASPQAAFEWPDAETKGTVLVNVTQEIIQYVKTHPDWFFDGELVLTYSVPIGADRAAAEQRYQEDVGFLKSKRLIVGTYISGTTAKPEAEQKRWPYETVPVERLTASNRITGFWPKDPHRRMIEVADVPTRGSLQAGIRREWQAHPSPLRFVDNSAAHRSVGGTQPWDAQCAHVREIREIAESLGSRVVFNVGFHPSFLSDQEASLLIQAVGKNGICLEAPWTLFVRKTAAESKKAESRYRQLLEAGMAIVMLPLGVPEDELERWVHSWNKPAYHLYFGGVFFKKPTHGVRLAPPPA